MMIKVGAVALALLCVTYGGCAYPDSHPSERLSARRDMSAVESSRSSELQDFLVETGDAEQWNTRVDEITLRGSTVTVWVVRAAPGIPGSDLSSMVDLISSITDEYPYLSTYTACAS
jgi:hypothetical protein